MNGERVQPLPLYPDHALPAEAPQHMPAQSLTQRPEPMRRPPADRRALLPRLFVLGGALALTVAFTREMYAVLSVVNLTAVELVMLLLFTISISWITLSSTSAVAGFLALCFARGRLDIAAADGRVPQLRTAILIPVYNEDPARVFATAAVTAQGLAAAGAVHAFDVFILSDTTDPDVWIAEEAALRAVRGRGVAQTRIYYRRRHENTGRKAGNIAEWVRRFGAAYPQFIVFDADSLMEPDTLLRLALEMERRPEAGLIQSVPVLAGCSSLFARMQQFASRLYGPLIACGLAIWHRGESNFWGHNAILRTAAFAGAAGLPHLEGRGPFGGPILSHDFVEAALLRRAGWKVYLAPTLEGSYEESPPTLLDMAVRDRRWCQGNLQHAKVIGARGLHWVSRMHMGMGIMSYLASPVWFTFLLAGLVLALQARFIRAEYFSHEFQLFPTWPAIDSQRAITLFVATMALLFLPKLLGLLLAIVRAPLRHGFGGAGAATLSLGVESVIAALMTPIMMATQTAAVIGILAGRDAGWKPQQREDGSVPWADLVRRHRAHTLLGLMLGISAWAVSPNLLAWMSPAVAGLLLTIPLSALTARRSAGHALRRAGLLLTPEERNPPPILAAARTAHAQLAAALAPAPDGLTRLRDDPGLLAFHRASLPPPAAPVPGAVDVDLVLGLARLDTLATLEEASRHLSANEKAALLADRRALDRLAKLPRRSTVAAQPARRLEA